MQYYSAIFDEYRNNESGGNFDVDLLLNKYTAHFLATLFVTYYSQP